MTTFATVLHLSTGHVLAAVSSGSFEPKVEQLTADDHLVVRYFGPDARVEVPASLLTAVRVAADEDLLDRPHSYVATTGTPPVVLGLAPVEVPATAMPPGPAAAKCVIVWQMPDGTDVSNTPLNAAGQPLPKSAAPAGSTHRLIAWETGPVILETL
jgi:hypothetical protein